jgi:hypothetical protein
MSEACKVEGCNYTAFVHGLGSSATTAAWNASCGVLRNSFDI